MRVLGASSEMCGRISELQFRHTWNKKGNKKLKKWKDKQQEQKEVPGSQQKDVWKDEKKSNSTSAGPRCTTRHVTCRWNETNRWEAENKKKQTERKNPGSYPKMMGFIWKVNLFLLVYHQEQSNKGSAGLTLIFNFIWIFFQESFAKILTNNWGVIIININWNSIPFIGNLNDGFVISFFGVFSRNYCVSSPETCPLRYLCCV